MYCHCSLGCRGEHCSPVRFTRQVDLLGWLQRAAYMPPLQTNPHYCNCRNIAGGACPAPTGWWFLAIAINAKRPERSRPFPTNLPEVRNIPIEFFDKLSACAAGTPFLLFIISYFLFAYRCFSVCRHKNKSADPRNLRGSAQSFLVRYSYLNLRFRAASDFFLRLTEGFS